jgi:WD40 repeat protein
MPGHAKAVTCLDIDSEGIIMVSGSADYTTRIWDFSGMNRQLKPTREWKPYNGYPMNFVRINKDGSKFLGITGSY